MPVLNILLCTIPLVVSCIRTVLGSDVHTVKLLCEFSYIYKVEASPMLTCNAYSVGPYLIL